MATIVFDAIPFCYGPAAALLALAEALASRGLRIRAAGTGTTAELLTHSDRIELVRCPAGPTPRISTTKSLLREAHLYVNIVDPEVYGAVSEWHGPKVYVDFLFWMFLPQYARAEVNADLYLIENYPGAGERLERYYDHLKAPVLIPPLIQSSGARSRRAHRRLLVCFGGLESPLTRTGVNTNYPYLMTETLIRVLDGVDIFDDILVTGNQAVMAELSARYGRPRIAFRHLAHDRFIAELEAAHVLLTHPGLYTPFEAFAAGVPVVFLPSSNYTQVLQLRFYRELGLSRESVDWHDLGCPEGSGPIPEGLPEERGVERVLECIRAFERSRDAQGLLTQVLAKALRNACDELEFVVRLQHGVFEKYSWDDGPAVAADLITGIL